MEKNVSNSNSTIIILKAHLVIVVYNHAFKKRRSDFFNKFLGNVENLNYRGTISSIFFLIKRTGVKRCKEGSSASSACVVTGVAALESLEPPRGWKQ